MTDRGIRIPLSETKAAEVRTLVEESGATQKELVALLSQWMDGCDLAGAVLRAEEALAKDRLDKIRALQRDLATGPESEAG